MKPQSEEACAVEAPVQSVDVASEQQMMTRREFTRRLAQLAVLVPVVAGVSLQAPKALAMG